MARVKSMTLQEAVAQNRELRAQKEKRGSLQSPSKKSAKLASPD